MAKKQPTKYEKFSDLQISELAQAVEQKNSKYKRSSQKSFYLTQQGDKRTIFERSGLLDEKGKAKSIEDIKADLGTLINWKMTMTRDKLLSDNYVRERWIMTKDNYETMAKTLGNNQLAEEIANMKQPQFRKLFRQGKFNNLTQHYDEMSVQEVIDSIVEDYNEDDIAPELLDD